jgi:hypothetical protein
MIIKTLSWESVKVTCETDSSKNAEFKEATVKLDPKFCSLSIFDGRHPWGTPNVLYAKAEIVSMTPWDFKAKAYWWSDKDKNMIPVEINGVF